MIERDLKYRIYEGLPAITVTFIFLFLFIFSFIAPIFVIYFIIIYDVLFLARVIYNEINIVLSINKLKETIKVDWFSKIKNEHNGSWEDLYHLIFLPTYKEPIEVMRDSFSKLSNSKYDLKKMIVVLAGEDAEGQDFVNKAEIIEKEFGSNFLKFIKTVHVLECGEIRGKGSNCASAGKIVKDVIDKEFSNIPYKNIIVSNFDIDTVVHEQYFAHLTYLNLTIDDPMKVSFQPLSVFNNNFWEAAPTNRLTSRGSTFWLLAEFMKDQRIFTFSSHSMNFQTLVNIGFWHSDVVSEDSRAGLQCINYYNGDYKVMPVYIPVSMDVVTGNNFFKSLINQYKQQRRWAYGMENFPYMMREWRKNKNMSNWIKFKYIFKQFEGGISWATASIIMFVFGFLPLIIVNNKIIGQSIIVRNAPFILQGLMRFSMVGILINALLSAFLWPRRNGKIKFYEYILVFIEWAIYPITSVVLGSIPANEAYFRLLFGKYLGFWVTPKDRK